jgi:hypothetical protein
MVEWLHATGEFERRLAEQHSQSVIAPHIESQTRRGRTYVAVNVLMTVLAPDVAEALATALDTFRQAAGDDEAGWDMASARAEVWPEQT